jgi:hypothetical protein
MARWLVHRVLSLSQTPSAIVVDDVQFPEEMTYLASQPQALVSLVRVMNVSNAKSSFAPLTGPMHYFNTDCGSDEFKKRLTKLVGELI